MQTNHLSKLFSRDDGTWRRIKIIPFLHKFQGKEDILNYSDVLVDESGGYILTWIIEGAKKVIEKRFKLEIPKAVRENVGHLGIERESSVIQLLRSSPTI